MFGNQGDSKAKENKDDQETKQDNSDEQSQAFVTRINRIFNHNFEPVLAHITTIALAFTAAGINNPSANAAMDRLTEIVRMLNNQTGSAATNIRDAITLLREIADVRNIPAPMDPDVAGINFHLTNLRSSITNTEANLNILVNNLNEDVNTHFRSATAPGFGRR